MFGKKGVCCHKKLLMILCAIMLVSMTACSESSEGGSTNEQVIYESEVLKATSLGISSGMLKVRLENKTDGQITVLPMDSSVDGTMVQFTSGTLATIQPGKTFNQAWIIGEAKESVEFTMTISDGEMAEIEKTDIIRIEVQ